MDPTIFATIIGLICNYRQEKGATDAGGHQQFMEWLAQHNFEQLKNQIRDNTALQTGLTKLSRAEHREIMTKLDAINLTLATLLSRVPDFRELTMAMIPSAELSDQAVDILRQLVNSKSSFFFYLRFIGGFSMQLEEGEQIGVTDLRFLDDDLDKLVASRFLSLEENGDNQIYQVTRNAVRLIQTIDSKPQAA